MGGEPRHAPGSSTVEITLTPEEEFTVVRVRHSGFPSDERRAMHQAGWNRYLDRLAVTGSGGDPGPDAPQG